MDGLVWFGWLAAAGLAPELYHVHTLHDGSKMVVMEWMEGACMADQYLLQHLDRAGSVVDALQRAVAVLHAQGIVHTDLRPANIIVFQRGEELRVQVVDFDWSSPEAAKAVYPPRMNPALRWPVGASDGMAQRPHHDWHWVLQLEHGA